MEVIEHVDPPRLPALAGAVFGHARPATVVVTTPNVEYNVRYEGLAAGTLRHHDHRFEWTRAEFAAWADACRDRYGYPVAARAASATTTRGGRTDPAGRVHPAGGDRMTTLDIPELSLVVAGRRLRLGQVDLRPPALPPTQVLSSDAFRAMVADDENDQSASADAFDALHHVAGMRLRPAG